MLPFLLVEPNGTERGSPLATWKGAAMAPHQDTTTGTALLNVSNAMVRLYKQHFGRGPTNVRSYYAGPNVVVCVLEHTFTTAERSMVKMGEHQRLRDARLYFQHATEGEFRQAVGDIVGRPVVGFGSGTDTTTDMSFEIFTFEPLPKDATNS